jgi:hypothetical protein
MTRGCWERLWGSLTWQGKVLFTALMLAFLLLAILGFSGVIR